MLMASGAMCAYENNIATQIAQINLSTDVNLKQCRFGKIRVRSNRSELVPLTS